MTAPDIIKELVQRFEEQKAVYLSKNYTETPVRRDFIDPFFKALGWDIDNNEGYAETYRDVIHEDRVNVEGKSKNPDYSFRVGGVRKFFVEAKQPSVSIKNDQKPAFQLRRYGWSGKLPVSILTDFEEFAVYDCTIKPSEKDPASKGRLHFYTYQDYVEKWDEIAGLFSKQAIMKGSFDRFADKKKRGTAAVDDEFLADIEKWRQSLASNILQNNEISQRDLNYAVQITIDRIIFLRICEDRGIEPYGKLEKLKNSKGDIYKKLVGFFKDADDKYNSGLFHFNEKEKNPASICDTLTPKIKIDDAPLREILDSLYFPNPYEFSVIPADILGQVYERFLGKVIQVDGKNAIIEEKPEVKKAGGVFYTPTYIVEYIVANTVDKLLEGKTLKQVESLSVLDPACGSGSFLIVAYQHLLDWHLSYYTNLQNGGAIKFKKQLHQTQIGSYSLTTQERKRILLNNIYGVDIDSQAVEVTKLSLLLKVLEGESNESIASQFKLFHERTLPDLGSNIKCGNSLISSDFYAQLGLPELNEDEHYRVNVFDWKDAFASVFKQGGFDAIIGNPPYLGGREWAKHNRLTFDYFMDNYSTLEYQFDMYAVFIDKALKLLSKDGLLSFITPNTWLNNKGNLKLRQHILKSYTFNKILDCTQKQVFDTATVLTIVFLLQKKNKADTQIEVLPKNSEKPIATHSINQSAWLSHEEAIINTNLKSDDTAFLTKIEKQSKPLETFADVKFGIKLYQVGKGNPKQTSVESQTHKFESDHQIDATYRPYLEGKDISLYSIDYKGRWLKYGKHLAEPRYPELFEGERILCRRIVGSTLICAYTNEDYVTSQLLQIVKPYKEEQAKLLVGLLSSRLIYFYFAKKYNRTSDKTFPEIRIYELRSLPIKIDKEFCPKIASLVERLLALDSQKSPQAKGIKQGIDDAVYQLYGLTAEERQQIEDATA